MRSAAAPAQDREVAHRRRRRLCSRASSRSKTSPSAAPIPTRPKTRRAACWPPPRWAPHDALERAAALVEAGVDVLVLDTAHGHAARSCASPARLKERFPEVDLIAGNVVTREGTRALIEAGVDAREGRRRRGQHLHDARGHRRRHAADHGHRRVRRGRCRVRCPDRRRWRREVLGRRGQGPCRRRAAR